MQALPSSHEENRPKADHEQFQLLIFKIMNTRFGVVLDEIYELLDPEQANQRECPFISFEDRFHFKTLQVRFKSPKVLLMKDQVSSGILIDCVQEIIEVTLDSVSPLPPLVQKHINRNGIWGTLLDKDDLILLIDLC